jgi:integrase
VLGPLLAWSIRFTTDFAPDVLACCRQWHAGRASRAGFRGQVTAAQARQLLASRATRRQPLPGRNGKVNILALAKELGCSRHVLMDLASEVGHAAATAGVTPWACYPLPVTRRLDSEPWIPGIATHPRSPGSLDELARLLQTACYVIIAFLSGMRDSEVKHLRRRCLAVSRDADGRPYRWRITSVAFKGERDAARTAIWVVGQPVALAVKVLEKLQPAGAGLLFAQLPYGTGAGPSRRSPNQVPKTATTSRQLNKLAAWISGYCRQHGRADGIPAVNGQPFRLQTRQFRRTLAWFIARQPGGVIAGAIQYRHLSIQMFQGYAGTSDSGFRAEVEAEQALARGEHLLAMIHKQDHECLTGPAASQAAQRLAGFGQRARFRGIAITDNRQLGRLMQRADPAVYPGTYATCVYNPGKALFRQQHDTRDNPPPNAGQLPAPGVPQHGADHRQQDRSQPGSRRDHPAARQPAAVAAAAAGPARRPPGLDRHVPRPVSGPPPARDPHQGRGPHRAGPAPSRCGNLWTAASRAPAGTPPGPGQHHVPPQLPRHRRRPRPPGGRERRHTPPPPSRYDQAQQANARLRQDNRQLRDQLELAAVIQRITLENQRLRQQAEAAAKVTRIGDPPRGRR